MIATSVPSEMPRMAWTVREVSAMTRIPIRTVYALLDAGELAYKRVGRRKFIPDTELRRFIADRSDAMTT